jgi:hypothetical protein
MDGDDVDAVRAAVAMNTTPQAIAANAQGTPRLESTGNTIEASPRRAGRMPALQAVSLQPSGRRLAKRLTPMSVKLRAAMKP